MAAELTPEQEELLAQVTRKFNAADTTHKRLREDWDRWDRLYHTRRDFLRSHAEASPRDRDSVIDDARKEFGADLFIPYAFSVVETVLPRILSNRPRMLWTPRDEASARNVENVRIVMDAQQHKANYELKLQATARSGLIYGLGVQKVDWRYEKATRKRLRRRVMGDVDGRGEYAVEEYACVPWDDPDVEDVSIYDFLWDPYGACMSTVGYVIHRSWRSTEYVLRKLQSGEWGDLGGLGTVALDREDLEGGGGKQKYMELWARRWNTQGDRLDLKEPVHEVWELHDGAHVVTTIDRRWPVAVAENPAWHGRMPFHIFRPTEVLHQFCGKGEVEPMEDLQNEMNELRSDRRWNAKMTMHRAYWYLEGSIDPDEVRIGPGELNAVEDNGSGNLRDMVLPVTVGDIPNSSYQEELALQQDIERVTGISDMASGATGAEQTATGVQLVQASAGIRIANKTRRIELELIKPEAEDWLALNQQRITEARSYAVPAEPAPGEPERRWAWRQIGPEELAGEFSVEPDGGSTAPENIPQLRQDAQMLMGLLQLPGVDAGRLLPVILEKFGLKTPEMFLAPEVRVPVQTLDLIVAALVEGDVPQRDAEQLVGDALMTARQMEEQEARGAGGQPGAEQLAA